MSFAESGVKKLDSWLLLVFIFMFVCFVLFCFVLGFLQVSCQQQK